MALKQQRKAVKLDHDLLTAKMETIRVSPFDAVETATKDEAKTNERGHRANARRARPPSRGSSQSSMISRRRSPARRGRRLTPSPSATADRRATPLRSLSPPCRARALTPLRRARARARRHATFA